MKKWLFAILFGSVLVLGACGGDNNDNNNNANNDAANNNGSVDVTAAETAYKANCASCHGGDLEGGMGPALDKAGANYSADEIADIIENGTGGMAAQTQVSAEDVTLLSEWLADKK